MTHVQKNHLGRLRATLRKTYRQRYLFVMLLPCVAVTFIFSYLPVKGLYMAFVDYIPGIPLEASKWAGLKYFKMFFNSSDFFMVLKNTLALNFLQLFFGPVCAISLAVILSEIRMPRYKKFVQTASYLPYFISWVIAASIIKALLSVDKGVVNSALLGLGLIDKNVPFLTKSAYFWPIVTVAQLWKSFGWDSILYLAVIASISREMYEAAQIDGCSRLQKVWYIILPCLLPTMVILMVMNSGWILNGFDPYYLLSNPATREAAEVIDTYVFRYGLQKMNYSYATAVGLMKSAVGLSMVITVNQIGRRLSDFELL